jgi:hypothetical protein
MPAINNSWVDRWVRCLECGSPAVRSPQNMHGCGWCGGKLVPLDSSSRRVD